MDKDLYRKIYGGLSECEIKFMDIIRLIIDAGWCLDPNSFQDILVISGVDKAMLDLLLFIANQNDIKQDFKYEN